jgi:hypothetical protein
MRKIAYNLAASHRIDVRRFIARAAILLAAILVLGGIAAGNLIRQHEKNLLEKKETGLIGERTDEMNRSADRQKKEIDAWKKIWQGELAMANSLIERKSFSFVSQLDFLEKAFSPGIRIRQLSLANEAAGQIHMTITAQSLKELFALYKKLAPYELVIAHENQTQEEYQVNLHFNLSHEKK